MRQGLEFGRLRQLQTRYHVALDEVLKLLRSGPRNLGGVVVPTQSDRLRGIRSLYELFDLPPRHRSSLEREAMRGGRGQGGRVRVVHRTEVSLRVHVERDRSIDGGAKALGEKAGSDQLVPQVPRGRVLRQREMAYVVKQRGDDLRVGCSGRFGEGGALQRVLELAQRFAVGLVAVEPEQSAGVRERSVHLCVGGSVQGSTSPIPLPLSPGLVDGSQHEKPKHIHAEVPRETKQRRTFKERGAISLSVRINERAEEIARASGPHDSGFGLAAQRQDLEIPKGDLDRGSAAPHARAKDEACDVVHVVGVLAPIGIQRDQRSHAHPVHESRICAGEEETANDAERTPGARLVEWCPPAASVNVDPRSAVKEKFDDGQRVRDARVVERPEPPTISSVDLGAAEDQRPDGLQVTVEACFVKIGSHTVR